MSKRSMVVAIVAVASLGVGATQVPAAGKHTHKVPVKQYEVEFSVPPGAVGGDFVVCPLGHTATGGGVDYVAGLGRIASSGFGAYINQYVAVIDNFEQSLTSTMRVQVACVKGTKPARARVATRAQAEAGLEADIAALERAHREGG